MRKSILKKKNVVIIILILLIFMSFVKINFSNSHKLSEEIDDVFLKTATTEIDIITPTESVYKKPMYGYYPGSNSFDNDGAGNQPSWFQEVKTNGGNVQVIKELDGHYNILEIHDTNKSDNALVGKNLFALPESGTIEYWMRTDNSSNVCGFSLIGGVIPAQLLALRTWNNELQRYNGTDWLNFRYWNGTEWYIPSIKNNRWYQIRIDFECSNGNYSGLTQHTWTVYIDGGQRLGIFPLITTKAFVNRINWYTDWLFGASNYKYYLDAIGFSWIDGYSIADNRNQGLFLSFRAPSNLTWIEYSLDGKPNITINGNFTIPKPGNGLHTLQVFGEDSIANTYSSEIINFEVDNPTFLLIPPYGGSAASMYILATTAYVDNNGNNVSDFVEHYGFSNIIPVNYYDNTTGRPEFDGLSTNSSTKEIAAGVKNYILNEHLAGNIKDTVDIWAYSFGGLVSRSMIKEYYNELMSVGITINHVAISGTPNHGLWFMVKAVIDKWDNITEEEWQQTNFQMYPLNEFLMDLNSEDETPHDIQYTTYASVNLFDSGWNGIDDWYENIMIHYNTYNDTIKQIVNQIRDIIGIYSDGLATTFSTPLSGAKNKFYLNINHVMMGGSIFVIRDILSDLKYYPRAEITLIDPKNQTYYEPMDGYYSGTYGFENDLAGYKPIWFEEIGIDGGTIKVIEELGGHKKVLEISDTSLGFLNAYVRKNFSSTPSYGTIEYWMRTDDARKTCGFRIDQGSVLNEMVTMRTFFNFLQYYNGTGWKNIQIIFNNTWYHIRVDFECTSGGYQGLSQYSWRLFVNGISYGDFQYVNNQSFADGFVLYNDHLHFMSNYKYYIDAIGLTWDTGYTIGDNLNEGLLLDFEKNLPHEWISYTVDGLSNLNIFGDTTIPMLSDGTHFIQVSYEDFSGEIIQSERIYFSIDVSPPEIQINTPFDYSLYGKAAPTFSIYILESNLHNMWYTLDGGITKILFVSQTELIDQVEWNKFGNGTLSLRVYANDTGGHENYVETIIRKDIIGPIINIHDPLFSEVFGTIPPFYNISIEESSGLDSVWFTFDGGIYNYSLSTLTGTFDHSLWSSIPDGLITLRIYARDNAGNVGYTDITFSKETPEDSNGIPGYDTILLIGAISLGILLIRKKISKIKSK